MPAATPNAADLALRKNNPYLAGMILAVQEQTPVWNSFPMNELNGTSMLALALASLPAAIGFLDINEGMTSTKAQLVTGRVDAARIGALIESAVSSTKLWEQQNPGINYIDFQVKKRLVAELQNIEKVIFLGTVQDAKAFYGLKQICAPTTANTQALTASATYPFTKTVLNVGGSTSNTATSVFSVCHGPEDVTLYMGGPQGVAGFLSMSPIVEQYQLDPGSTTKKQPYYITSGEGYCVLSVFGSGEAFADRSYPQYSVRRAMNITADSGKGCTEAVLDKLIAMHPQGHKPTAFYMSIRSQEQLLADRIANGVVQLNPSHTGTVRAGLPTEHRGIPIIVAEAAITDTQAIETVV